jgi:uncharacterized protein
MLIVISPSKTQDFQEKAYSQSSVPVLLEHSQQLVDVLRGQSVDGLQQLMNISPKLAALNVQRFNDFSQPFTVDNACPALQAFKGDVYQGFPLAEYADTHLREYAQQHLRILSGLYGVLRPWDLIQAYRLEMKTALANARGKNLYQFWGSRITDTLNQSLDQQTDKVLVNLASNEYFKAVKPKLLRGRLLTIQFKEEKAGKVRVIALFAKRARGLMSHFILSNRIESVDGLKVFCENGYRYEDTLSNDQQWTFVRPQP